MVEHHSGWGRTGWGAPVSLFTLSNDVLRFSVTDFGAALVSLEAPDQSGNLENVTVTAPGAAYYLKNPSSLGATIGRFANRIAKGQFWLEGKQYTLATNNGPNHLHGGPRGFAHVHWTPEPGTDQVTFRYLSQDGDEGYPGTLHVAVTYRLDGTDLVLDYSARCDAPTVLNLTNHAYWNLAGKGSVLDHSLELWSDFYLENDENILPTGHILDVSGTPFDFRVPRPIGGQIAQVGNGYDNCFLVRNWDSTVRLAARAIEPQSGRVMEVHTTEPGVQLYTANHFNGSADSAGYGQHEAFCLECQHFPDSPNEAEFPSTTLRPGEEYRQTSIYRFLTN